MGKRGLWEEPPGRLVLVEVGRRAAVPAGEGGFRMRKPWEGRGKTVEIFLLFGTAPCPSSLFVG